ncbi:hypothetical protein BDF19DRAFT_443106 [Syncephalis fuscata]|nr:hypothetical protein BDF19DRAFT_443106 [Syncephalis fuscata]
MSREINFRFDEKWRENATKLLGVPLHPLGELNPYDAVVKKTDGQEPVEKVVRQRMFMFQVQLFFNMLLLFAFLYISYISAKLIVKRKSNIAAWCNFISSILGASVGIVYMLMMLSSYGNCRIFAWYILTTGIIGTMCNTTAVLQRAYLALGGKGWVAMVGILLILPESSFAFYTIATSYTGTDDAGGCVCIYDNFTAPLWFMVIMPINILFSTIFCYVTYTQYCKFGLDAWRRLARDGIQSMCLIVICNILCGGLLLEK